LSKRTAEDLHQEIKALEQKVNTGKSDIEEAVAETKHLYRQVRSMETQLSRVTRFAETMGLALPTVSLLGPYAAFASIAFQVASLVAKEITRQQQLEDERKRAQELADLRRDLVSETMAEIEAKRRENYRGVVPG
jgi:hypothetical protein